MNKKNHSDGIKRREFLETGAKFAASAMFLGVGGSKLFGALKLISPGNAISIPTVTLNNGIKMPMLGYGTMTIEGTKGEQCVADAISAGYRLLDTATIYGTETTVGNGIKKNGIKREELFITTKLWVDDMGYEKTKKGFERSLNKLQTEYVDLYLIHRPRGDYKGSWKAMEELYKAGKIKAIGVSNFDVKQLDDLIANSTVKPVINQIETHAFFQEAAAQEMIKQHNMRMEAWAPFAEGRNGLFTNPVLVAIAGKHKKTTAQVELRWLLQRGIVAIPRTSKKEHMAENLNILDFKLDNSDMQAIAGLDLNKSQFPEWS